MLLDVIVEIWMSNQEVTPVNMEQKMGKSDFVHVRLLIVTRGVGRPDERTYDVRSSESVKGYHICDDDKFRQTVSCKSVITEY